MVAKPKKWTYKHLATCDSRSGLAMTLLVPEEETRGRGAEKGSTRERRDRPEGEKAGVSPKREAPCTAAVGDCHCPEPCPGRHRSWLGRKGRQRQEEDGHP